MPSTTLESGIPSSIPKLATLNPHTHLSGPPPGRGNGLQ